MLVNPHHTVTYAKCNGRWCTSSGLAEYHIRQFCVFTAPSSVNCASSVQRICSDHMASTSIRARNWRAKSRRCCGSWGLSCCTIWILQGYQCKLQRRIFLIIDYGTPNSRDTARALVAEFGTRSARSATATATSPWTSIWMVRLPFPGATPKFPVFSNFIIFFFFNPFVDIGPLLSPFMGRYSLNAALF